MRLSFKFLIALIGLALSCISVRGNIITDSKELTPLEEIYYCKAGVGETITDAQNKRFSRSTTTVVNLGLTDSEYWLRIPLTNNTSSDEIFLNLENANLSYVEVFAKDDKGNYISIYTSGTNFNFSKREFATPNFVIKITQPRKTTQQYFLRVKSNLPLVIPIFAGNRASTENSFFNAYLVFCIYIGIIICMLFYNVFLMVSVRNDRSYFWYVLHTLFVGLTQASILGFAFQYLWPDLPIFTHQSVAMRSSFG